MENKHSSFVKSSVDDMLSCVGISPNVRRDVITTPSGLLETRSLSGLTINKTVETGDKRNEAQPLSPAAAGIDRISTLPELKFVN